MRMRHDLKLKIATAIYNATNDNGRTSYDRLAPVEKDIYEAAAVAAYHAIKVNRARLSQ